MKYSKTFVIIASFFTLAWFGGMNAENYFPLQEGWTWEYTGVYLNAAGQVEKRAESTTINLAPREINGQDLHSYMVTPQKHDIRIIETYGQTKRAIVFDFIAKDTEGIYILAKQYEKDEEPRVNKNNLSDYLIINPFKINTTKMEGSATSYYQIRLESISDSVTVPAGTFIDCIKVVHESKNNEGIITKIYWYAKGIGKVKAIVTWQNKSKFIYQLQAYKK